MSELNMISRDVKLSKKQMDIVLIDSGPICVKAVAGSGKTRVLTERIRNILSKTNRKILALTFTNKAAEEMSERLSDITNIRERAFIGTFHGFAQFVLENHGTILGFKQMPEVFEDEGDRLKILESAIKQAPEILNTYKNLDASSRRAYCSNMLGFISQIKRELISIEDLQKKEDEVQIYSNYQEILSSINAMDYDDLLLYAYRLLSGNPNVASLYRRSYPYIFIDEAQDLNNIQYQILLALTSKENFDVMMVGDPNQSIFAFNGSSPKYMEENFIIDFSPKVIELTENFRSSKKVIYAANKLIPGLIEDENTVIEGRFELHEASDELSEAEWVVEKIENLLNEKEISDIEGVISYEKFAILGRNRYLFSTIQQKLKERNIPFWFKSSSTAVKFESNTMKVFDLALRIRLNPSDSLHKHQLLKFLKQKEFDFLTLEELFSIQIDSLFKRVIELVLMIHDDGSNLKSLFYDLQSNINLPSFDLDDNERLLIHNDISELIVRWNNYARKAEKKSLQNFKIALALGQTEPNAQPKGITLSTVHTMKGQEYDIVFIIGLDQETFPDYRALRKGTRELEQEKNNLYVAFTRAKRFLFVSWPAKRLMPWGDYKFRVKSQFLNEFI